MMINVESKQNKTSLSHLITPLTGLFRIPFLEVGYEVPYWPDSPYLSIYL